MRYWPTDRDQQYVREDGEICDYSKIFNEDIAPQIIYDDDILMPNAAFQTMQDIMIGSLR